MQRARRRKSEEFYKEIRLQFDTDILDKVPTDSLIKIEEENDAISERSYDYLITREEFVDMYLNFTFSLFNIFLVAIANLCQFLFDTYDYFYNVDLKENSTFVIVIYYTCGFIIVFDIFGMIFRRTFKKLFTRSVYDETNINVFSLPSVLIDLPGLNSVEELKIVQIFCVFMRNYRIINFFFMIYWTDENGRFIPFAMKYILIYAFYIHTTSCIWASTCFRCNLINAKPGSYMKSSEMAKLKADISYKYQHGFRKKDSLYPSEIYLISIYYVTSSISFLGYESPSYQNDLEQGIVIFIVLSSNILNIIFMADLYAYVIQSYFGKAEYAGKLQLMAKYLSKPKVPKNTKQKILKYHVTLWEKAKATSMKKYTKIIPEVLKIEVFLDRYWVAFNQMYLFYDEPIYIKRWLASAMKTSYYNKGDMIVERGDVKEKVYFLARGSVSVLSEEDGESPLLNLGIGTVFGELNLFYPAKCRFSVLANNYCIVQTLSLINFRKLYGINCYDAITKLNKKIHKKLQNALKLKLDIKNDVKPLAKIKKLLKDEVEADIYDVRKVNIKNQFTNLYDGYIISKVDSITDHDDIFYKSSWPWKYRENSSFMFIWETLIFVVTIFMIYIWPYEVFFKRNFDGAYMRVFRLFVTVIFSVDLLVQTSTVVETSAGILVSFSDILTYRCDNGFLLEIIAAVPFDVLVRGRLLGEHVTLTRIICISMHLFKVLKIPKYLNKLETLYLYKKFSRVRFIGNVLGFLTISYIIACIYYLVVCFEGHNKCVYNSWINKIKLALINRYGEAEGVAKFMTSRFIILVQFSFNIATLSSIPAAYSLEEIFTVTAFALLILLIHALLVSSYGATIVLTDINRYDYFEKCNSMNRVMTLQRIKRMTKNRVLRFFNSQWEFDKATRNRNLFVDTPNKLYLEQQLVNFYHILSQTQIFQKIKSNVIKKILLKCETEFLPPNEVLIYGGIRVPEMYVIQAGYCQLVSPITKKLKKVLGPGDELCALEMFLGQKSVYDVVSLTHVSLIKINYLDLIHAFSTNNQTSSGLKEVVKSVKETVKNENIKLFTTKKYKKFRSYEKPEDETSSWFFFSKTENSVLAAEYKDNFKSSFLLWFLQYIVMRRTLLPYSKFLYCWEMIRTIIVWICCISQQLEFLLDEDAKYVEYYAMTICEIFFLFDMYLQLHVCYFNSNGALVTHPYYTSTNYFRSRFLFDFIGFIPFGKFVPLMFPNSAYKILGKHRSFFGLNRLFLIIRTRYFLGNSSALKMKKIKNILLYRLYILMILYTYLPCFFMLTSGSYYTDNGQTRFLPDKDSWANDPIIVDNYDTNSTIHFFMASFKIMTFQIMNIGNEDFIVTLDYWEKIFSSASALIGYIFFLLTSIEILATFTINPNVTRFQHNIKSLKKFLKRYKGSKKLKTMCLEYYNLKWQKTYGVLDNIFDITSRSIHQDLKLMMYGGTISLASPFIDVDISFLRKICVHFRELYFCENTPIIKVNDIVENAYVLHSGEIEVRLANGKIIQNIYKGSFFGNYDNISMIRSMVAFVAVGNVSLLYISTVKLYEILESDSDPMVKIKKHVITQNLSYMPGIDKPKIKPKQNLQQRPMLQRIAHKMIANSVFPFINLASCMASYIFSTFYLVFNDGQEEILILLLVLDCVTTIIVFFDLMNYNPTKKYRSFKNRLKYKFKNVYFLLDFISIIPFNLIALIFDSNKGPLSLYRILQLNRALRIYNVYIFFHVIDRGLSKNLVFYRIGCITSYTYLTLHTGICIFYGASCTGTTCTQSTWVWYDNKYICGNVYLCTMLYTVNFFTTRGFWLLNPYSTIDITLAVIYSTFCSFLMASFIGYSLGVAAHVKFKLTKYNDMNEKLKGTLLRSNISPFLISKVSNYTSLIWKKNQGEQMPQFLVTAPKFLAEAIKMEVFGYHILNNIIFQKCHEDFLRQLIGHLNFRHYFTKDIICHEGSVNGEMYFVHSGNVEVITYDNSDENIIDILSPNDTFGVYQGLFRCVVHKYTYRARNVVEIVSLKFTEWDYLLQFFPASKFSIYDIFNKPEVFE